MLTVKTPSFQIGAYFDGSAFVCGGVAVVEDDVLIADDAKAAARDGQGVVVGEVETVSRVGAIWAATVVFKASLLREVDADGVNHVARIFVVGGFPVAFGEGEDVRSVVDGDVVLRTEADGSIGTVACQRYNEGTVCVGVHQGTIDNVFVVAVFGGSIRVDFSFRHEELPGFIDADYGAGSSVLFDGCSKTHGSMRVFFGFRRHGVSVLVDAEHACMSRILHRGGAELDHAE